MATRQGLREARALIRELARIQRQEDRLRQQANYLKLCLRTMEVDLGALLASLSPSERELLNPALDRERRRVFPAHQKRLFKQFLFKKDCQTP